METFVRWAFGPRHLAYLAADVDLAWRSAQLLEAAPEPMEIRRRLLHLSRIIQAAADARFLYAEADLAGGLERLLRADRVEPWMSRQLRDGYAQLARMISRRLVRMALIERRAAPFAVSSAA